MARWSESRPRSRPGTPAATAISASGLASPGRPVGRGRGPLINSKGRVVGVPAQIATGNTGSDGNIGIGFAIPVNTVRTVVAQLIKKGKVDHAFIGITAKPVTAQIARLFRLPSRSGLLVATVQPRSGAAGAPG